MSRSLVRISHWLPIVTVCPVNNLPELIFVTVELENRFLELYAARRKIRKLVKWRRMFMEDIATKVLYNFPEAKAVEVRLAFGKHFVRIDEPRVA